MTSHELSSQVGNWALFIDTSSLNGRLGVICLKDYKSLYDHLWEKPIKHSDALVPEFKKILQKFEINKLKCIYCLNGPGSFTGLRVSAAFIKSLCFTRPEVKIYSFSSFLPYAIDILKNTPHLKAFEVHIPSIGGKSFSSTFKHELSGKISESLDLSGAQKRSLSKTKHPIYLPSLSQSENSYVPSKYNLNNLAKLIKDLNEHQVHQRTSSFLDFYPLYLRASEAEEKLKYDSFNKK